MKFIVARMVDGEGWAAGRAEMAKEAGVREEGETGTGEGGGATLSPGRTTQGRWIRAGVPTVR